MANKQNEYMRTDAEKLDLNAKTHIWFPLQASKKMHIAVIWEHWLQKFPSVGASGQAWQAEYDEYISPCGVSLKENYNNRKAKEGRLIECRGVPAEGNICPVCKAYYDGWSAGVISLRKKRAKTLLQEERERLPAGEKPWYDY